jgi:hypothetical protein
MREAETRRGSRVAAQIADERTGPGDERSRYIDAGRLDSVCAIQA